MTPGSGGSVPLPLTASGAGETVDARKTEEGWNQAGFNDGQWQESRMTTGPAGKLVPQSMPSEQVVELIRPVSLTEPQPGIFVYDLGIHIAGWVRFKTSGNEGQLVTLVFDENLNQDGTLAKRSLSSHTRGRYQTGELILSGKGSDLFEPRFTYHGFRYVQVTGLLSAPELDDLTGCMVHNNLARSGSFESSNDRINRIHEAARFALSNTLHSVQTEPAREKNQLDARCP
ncbi:MAG: family 78 glycoside hydrolase catalytic domain [Mangrovibacterium sp.]